MYGISFLIQVFELFKNTGFSLTGTKIIFTGRKWSQYITQVICIKRTRLYRENEKQYLAVIIRVHTIPYQLAVFSSSLFLHKHRIKKVEELLAFYNDCPLFDSVLIVFFDDAMLLIIWKQKTRKSSNILSILKRI